jgi:peptide/nickel transport system substrate-binding protein
VPSCELGASTIPGALQTSISGQAGLKLLENSENLHWVIHMRSDAGHVASDVRIRQALKLGTDHQAIIDAVRPGLAVVGNDTPVGPVYKDYYLDKQPAVDIAKAKELLQAAGQPNLKITLYLADLGDGKAIATVWKEQMAQIGVTVNIQVLPSAVYYGTGDTSWMKCDFGLTIWASRPTPVAYFNLAYVTGGLYNESHWSDPEFDSVTKQINSEVDPVKRAALYKTAQQILIDRGPVIVTDFEKSVAGASSKVEGVNLAYALWETQFKNAYLAK